MYDLKFSKKALKQLKKLDKSQSFLLINWIETNLVNVENPYQKGKGLTANRSGEWRYRVGNYRIICDIRDKELIILVIDIGHRSDIYKN